MGMREITEWHVVCIQLMKSASKVSCKSLTRKEYLVERYSNNKQLPITHTTYNLYYHYF